MRARTALLLALVPTLAGADVSVRAWLDPPRLQVGEAGELAVEIQGAQNVPAPAVGPVDGLRFDYVGPETQVSIVNGQMSAAVTHRYSVTPTRAGTFTIGPITVTHRGTTYEAGRVTLRVEPGAAPGQGTRGRTDAALTEQLQLDLRAAKSEVYLHERVPITITLRVGARVTDLAYPTVPGDGFAIDKIPQPKQRDEDTPGGTVRVVEFSTALTPLRAGALTVGPATMRLSRLVRSRQRGLFGGFFADTPVPLELSSEPLALTVLPLPEAGRPAAFSGAVGRFALDVRAAPLAVAAGDPVTVTTTIRGRGNLESVTPPAFAESDALRVYPAQAAGSPPGARVFEQVVIPERPGPMELPSLEWAFFDPDTRRYRTVRRPPIALAVRPSPTAGREPRIVGTRAAPERAESLGRDIVFIKDAPGRLRPIGARRYRSAVFWAWQAVPLLALLAAVGWDRRRRRLSGDVRYARFTRAGREARRTIAGARRALGDGDRAAFYDALAAAMRDYLAAKLDLPPGGVTLDAVADRLGRTGLPAALGDDLREFFAVCERARFAPAGDDGADVERTLGRADTIVRRLERERRLARTVAAAVLLAAVGAAAVGSTAAAAAAGGAESPNTIFFRAGALYGEERYAEAAAEYERIRAAGLESAPLDFNLGNAYFKAGDVGRAILNYERARRLAPGDPDVLANLGYARGPEAAGDGPAVWTRLLFPLAHRFGSDGLVLATSAAYTTLLLLLVLARLVPAARRTASRAALAAAACLAVVGSSAVYRVVTVDRPEWVVVVEPEGASVRFEPSAGGTLHFEAKAGTLLRLLGAREGWAQVARADGRRGWVERAPLAPL